MFASPMGGCISSAERAGQQAIEPAAPQPAPVQTAPQPGPRESSHECDVRRTSWYAYFRHSVFSVIETSHLEGASRILLVGIKPQLANMCTNAEFPAILEDVHRACMEKKAPFFKRGEEAIPFSCIEDCRVAAVALEKKLKSELADDALVVVIMSCTESDEGTVLGVIKNLNDKPQYQRRVKKAWATAEDMYGRPARPRMAAPSTNRQTVSDSSTPTNIQMLMDMGGYMVGQTVFVSKTGPYFHGERELIWGQAGVVVGPATWEAKDLPPGIVEFNGVWDSNVLGVAPLTVKNGRVWASNRTCLHERIVLFQERFALQFSITKLTKFNGTVAEWTNDRHEVERWTRMPEGSAGPAPKGVAVQFPGDLIDCCPSWLSETKPGPLPGGYEVGQKVYYLGRSHDCGWNIIIHHGRSLEIVGPGDSQNTVTASVDSNYSYMPLHLLSTSPPGPLPGGFECGQRVTVKQTVTDSDETRVKEGDVFEVRGPDMSDANALWVAPPGVFKVVEYKKVAADNVE